MNDFPFIVDEYGGTILQLESMWQWHVQEEGLYDPIATRMRVIRARIRGLECNEKMPSQEQFDNYRKQKE